jgi:hypothetical protein
MCEIVVNRRNEKRKPHRTATITAEELQIKNKAKSITAHGLVVANTKNKRKII